MPTRAELYAAYKDDWQSADGLFVATFTPRGGGAAVEFKATEADLTRTAAGDWAGSEYDTVWFSWDTTYGGAARPLENDTVARDGVSYTVSNTVVTMFGAQITLYLKQIRE